MTRQINQGDLEVVQTVLAAGREQAQITAALVYRGLDEQTAKRLVEDITRGRRVAIQSTNKLADGFKQREVSASKSAGEKPLPARQKLESPLLAKEEFDRSLSATTRSE